MRHAHGKSPTDRVLPCDPGKVFHSPSSKSIDADEEFNWRNAGIQAKIIASFRRGSGALGIGRVAR
jgi:hypothetical protein